MDALILDALLSAVSGLVVKAIPAWVAAHPQGALIALTVYALLEHIWPILARRGWVKGNSTLSVLLNAVGGALKAAFSKSLIRKGNQQ